jgi:phosphoribosylformimino-5-aminoimidazole carboxamide ribotide isomerase
MIKIPAIDLINGTCVRLTKGKFDRSTKYNVDPVELAKKYEDAGAKRIHIVDLDAARGIGTNQHIIFEIQKETKLKLQVGGGIHSVIQLEKFFEKGIDTVILGSIAQRNRKEVKKWISNYKNSRIIIGADVRNNKIAIDGWSRICDENIKDFIQEYKSAGATKFLCTDIQRDGTLSGTSNLLYKNLMTKFPTIKIIASGGVASLNDLDILEEMKIYACVIGKALFEKRITINELFSKSNRL